MEAEMLTHLEKLLGRELENSEKMRLQRIQDILKIGPNDALWSIIAALEYQRAYYEELPKKIHKTTEEILAEWSAAIRENLAVPQKRDGEKSAEQTRFTSLTWAMFALCLLLLCGCLFMWIGYSIGSGQI